MTGSKDERSEDEFLKGAYGLTDLSSAMEFYSDWAGEYDNRMERVLGYVAPRLMAEMFAKHMRRVDGSILDIGCGTGLTSHYLMNCGFGTIDGVDFNHEMLAKAKARAIYRDLLHADITQPINLPSASYDGIISSGTFTLGHVGPEPIPELVRLLKPQGILGCSIHQDIWAQDGFEESFAALEDDGVLQSLDRQPGEFFTGYGDTALYCVFQKA